MAQHCCNKAETTNWLYTNHLGAPEAATNSEGQIIWQASYAPFGGLIKTSLNTPKTTRTPNKAFELNLRLPGQNEDQAAMDADGSSKITGDVNMKEYALWLKQNYNFDIAVVP